MTDRGPSRLILIIASQWGGGPASSELGFLPPLDWEQGTPVPATAGLPLELYREFLQPESGACGPVPGLDEVAGQHVYEAGSSLVINPTLVVAESALTYAFAQAAERQQVLIVHFIGHGCMIRLTDYDPVSHRLFVADTSGDDTAWNPYPKAEELIKRHQLPGFVFMIDACQAARARPEIMKWGTSPTTYVWMGASQDTAAFDGCFSTTLLATMRHGDSAPGGLRPAPELHSRHLRRIVDRHCHRPADAKFPEADDVTSKADDYVFITRNRAVEIHESDLGLIGPTRDRLRSAIGEHYQIINTEPVNQAIQDHDFVVVTGGAGTGKTALSGVLRELPLDLNARRLDAVTFLENQSGLDEIALAIHPQLVKNQHYVDLLNRYERTADVDTQGPHERYVAGPLKDLRSPTSLLVGLDGLDQLAVERQNVVLDEYQRLVDASGGQFKVLATSRPASAGGPIPAQATTVPMPALTESLARSYLDAKGVSDLQLQQDIISLTDDLNWLVITLAANQVQTDPDAALTADESALYRSIVNAAEVDLGAEAVSAVVNTLVAAGSVAGVGPRLPFGLFAPAVARLGGPSTVVDLNAVLAHERLYRIIERANPATDAEHLGLFHLTAINALTPHPEQLQAAHRAITEALDTSLPDDEQ